MNRKPGNLPAGRFFILFFASFLSIFAVVFSANLARAGQVGLEGSITVCPAGPPACDFATIQAGLDGATAGDTVVVGSGTYNENISLKSGVLLTSTEGPTETIVTAANGPIVSGHQVTNTTIHGFTIRGRGQMTAAIGISLVNSRLAISHLTIENLYGVDNLPLEEGSAEAVGIQVSGGGALTISQVTIRYLMGRSIDPLNTTPGVVAGDAIGILARGTLSLAVRQTHIHSLRAGDNSILGYCTLLPKTTGLATSGDVSLSLQRSQVTNLIGGVCPGVFSWCPNYAAGGTVIGLLAEGGQVSAVDNDFAGFILPGDDGSSRAIDARQVTNMTAVANRITAIPGATSAAQEDITSLALAPCPLGGYDIVAIESSQAGNFTALGNEIRNLDPDTVTEWGKTVGILVKETPLVTIKNNTIQDLQGPPQLAGSGARMAAGIWARTTSQAEISANRVMDIRGGDGFFYLWTINGGKAFGIDISGTQDVLLENNVIARVLGGDGWSFFDFPADGGDATALQLKGSGQINNNTFYQTIAGQPDAGNQPDSGGQPGQATGLSLSGQATVYNNVITHHGVGMSVSAGSQITADYQGMWANGVNYRGVSAGDHDLLARPGFVDPDGDDFHLAPGSAYIDAGSNDGAPERDFEGEPRPLDGDDDGLALVDIGADELWPALYGSNKVVGQHLAAPGERLSYIITLINPYRFHDREGVVLTDVLPLYTSYISASLSATSGTANHNAGLITWYGVVPNGESITITYQVLIDDSLAGPYALINRAMVADGSKRPLILRATTLVDPLQTIFPLLVRS